ncbi:NAD(P)H-dependent oxidoreductase [Lactobacillus mulieris]|uniref:NADPH-dependent FMN reductase n=1 Tax=Lactobacillus mulieris TaxID=2508708 RepID=UPI001432A7AB|nr:NAD(P)H-dependent oxidoreductase [Lactobacillus mulieris]MCF1783802.1 NAD(P)H-dependent oxidoreductase [Lactobacillus mulieris]MCW8104764.1 NAD(P)H-dependent oxidoreductase [Lactobacillus mulieris]MDK6803087.1 NAD(P)H-dependent oxidoreductase [Lactobacillus mulieris]MDK8382203.1 NAD(P)H-dependent oxidoreductase [Lactobacillus mulieris]MDT9620345.1 NAD(P)H-dependent oxidoreductase [Lactobacillus mulieris]
MKLLAVVGTNADFSFNRFLAKYIAKRYGDKAEIEVAEINTLPLFNRESSGDKNVAEWREKIKAADGIILTTPEYDHAIPAALKSALEWLGSHAGADLMHMKPAMVVGTSYGMMGAARAQEEAREILLAPDMSANVLPGNEVLIGRAADNFDKATGDLTNQTYIDQLDTVMDNFIKFVAQNQK